MVHGFVRNANSFAPLKEGSRHSVVIDEDGVAPVSDLLCLGRPPTIPRAIVAVVVNAINRHASWAITHVGQELLKDVPFFANSYASTSIVRKVFRGRVFTPLPHTAPNVVRSCFALAVAPVIPARPLFQHEAPARHCSPIADVRAISLSLLAAVAQEPPYGPAFRAAPHGAERDEPAKPFPGEVNKLRVDRVVELHSGNSNRIRSQERVTKCMEAQ